MKNTTLQPVNNDAFKKENARTDKANNRIAEGLYTLFLDGLKDMNWAEKALEKAMPKMVKNAASDALTATLCRHLEMTQGHITQLESIFKTVGEKAKSKKCPIMSSLIREAEKTMDNTEKGVVRDAAIVSINRKIRHHEMANYSVLHALAVTLMEHDAAVLLRQSFEEEKEADEQLAAIAKTAFDAKITTVHAALNGKKTNGIATNKAVQNGSNAPKSDVLDAYLAESGASNVRVIRIVEVQYENQNGTDSTTLTRTFSEGPLSINVNLGAFSEPFSK